MLAFGGVLLVAIWCFANGWRNRILLTIGLLVVAITSAYLAVNFGPERLSTEGDQSSLERIILWGVAWELFQSSPVHGVGFGSFELINGRYLPDIPGMEQDLGAHNLYFELLAETGIIGLGAFFVFIFTAIRLGLRQLGEKDWLHRALAFTVFAGAIGLIISGFTDHSLFWSVQIGSLFWLLLGLLLASERRIQALHSLTETKSCILGP
jgi:O-antigen ligase